MDVSYPFWEDIEQAGIDKEAVYSTHRTDIANTDIEFFKCIGYFLNEFDGVGHLSVLDGYIWKIHLIRGTWNFILIWTAAAMKHTDFNRKERNRKNCDRNMSVIMV